MASVCWRAASPCPLPESSSGRKLSCQAWFRCEIAGNYDIKWRCQTVEEEELNLNGTALSLCQNQLDSRHLTECPPPVVCRDDYYKSSSRMKTSTLSTEITIVIALAVFALFTVLLLIVSSCKYWTLRKRHQPRHRSIRDYHFPISYHNFWGTDMQHPHHPVSKGAHPTRPQGNAYPDVYFSRPQGAWKHFEHLLTSSDDSLSNNILNRGDPRQGYSNSNKFKADPSVVTESFVYHQPVRVGNLGESSEGSEGWFYESKHVNNGQEDRGESLDCYHIYKGNMSRFQANEHHYTNRHTNFRHDYHHLVKSTADFNRTPRVSSIPIPVFGSSSLHEAHPHFHSDLQLREGNDERLLAQRRFDSDSSHGSESHNVFGVITKGDIVQHRNVSGSETHHKNDHHHKRTSSSVKVQTRTTPQSSRTSPDIINSHNFTNRFVRIGKNIYKPVLTRSPSGSSMSLSSTNHNYIDLSYDSFINDHLRELAKRGVASSSTLEAGYKQKEDSTPRELGSRF